eukprot:scaffold2184_cov128-Cylindrotheca_fusiformis.AAC.6
MGVQARGESCLVKGTPGKHNIPFQYRRNVFYIWQTKVLSDISGLLPATRAPFIKEEGGSIFQQSAQLVVKEFLGRLNLSRVQESGESWLVKGTSGKHLRKILSDSGGTFRFDFYTALALFAHGID